MTPTLADLQAHFGALDDADLEGDLARLTKIRARRFLYFDAVPVTSRLAYRARRGLSFDVGIEPFESRDGREVQALLSSEPLPRRLVGGGDIVVAARATYLPLVALHLMHFKTLRFDGLEAPGGAVWPSFELSRTEEGAWAALFDTRARGTYEGRVHTREVQQHRTAAEAVTFWAESILNAEPVDWLAGLGAFGGLGVRLGGGLGARLRAHAPIPDAALDYAMRKLAGKIRRCGITREALRAGMAVETEHSDVTHNTIEKTARIAVAHLCESPRYYVELARMERRLAR